MLLILMYHRVHGVGTVPDALRRHLTYLRDHHRLVRPGDPLPAGELSVCLSFDDVTVDFFRTVLAAVPTGYVQEATTLPMETRLAAQQRAVMSGRYSTTDCPLCTWAELRLMQASGRVRFASHGHSHASLTDPDTDLESELTRSRSALEVNLGHAPDTFVYPFGHTSRQVHRVVGGYYRYAMRIGNGLNRDWGGSSGLLSRVNAEHFWPSGRVWSRTAAVGYRLKYLGNRLRGL
jgi:hypothetical protein